MADIAPQTVVDIPTPVGPTRYVEVEVLVEGGIFKQGKNHKKGSKLTMELFSAENYAKAKEVKILKEVKNV